MSTNSIRIVHENDAYVVIDKPALVDSQDSKEGRASVVDWLEKKYRFKGLVHRLDFGTSGLMVCAKNKSAAEDLTTILQSGEMERTYQALVLKKLEKKSGKIDIELEGKKAITHYKTVQTFANATLVEAELETGRKHQIRQHFSLIGHPLLGEHRYGKSQAKLLFKRPALHACKLKIKGKTYESPLPDDFQDLIKRLGR